MSSTLREASKDTLLVNEKTWHYYSLPLAEKQLGDLSRLPKSLKVLMENLLRWQDGDSVTEEDIRALAGWLQQAHAGPGDSLPSGPRPDAGLYRRAGSRGSGRHARR
ncbi:hypothetical protein LNP26_28315 [Klebsiella variicola subsp. variicola]|nr:hypothetical protein [Klebsiella variicola subsp. variicola]